MVLCPCVRRDRSDTKDCRGRQEVEASEMWVGSCRSIRAGGMQEPSTAQEGLSDDALQSGRVYKHLTDKALRQATAQTNSAVM